MKRERSKRSRKLGKNNKQKQPHTVRRYIYIYTICIDRTCCDLFRLYNITLRIHMHRQSGTYSLTFAKFVEKTNKTLKTSAQYFVLSFLRSLFASPFSRLCLWTSILFWLLSSVRCSASSVSQRSQHNLIHSIYKLHPNEFLSSWEKRRMDIRFRLSFSSIHIGVICWYGAARTTRVRTGLGAERNCTISVRTLHSCTSTDATTSASAWILILAAIRRPQRRRCFVAKVFEAEKPAISMIQN